MDTYPAQVKREERDRERREREREKERERERYLQDSCFPHLRNLLSPKKTYIKIRHN